MNHDPLYKVSWEVAFAEFVEAVEHYVALELPADVSPAERKLQIDLREHLMLYKAAKEVEERGSPSKKTD